MTQLAAQERAAIVLGMLGDTARDAVLNEFPSELASQLRSELERLEEAAPSAQTRDETLDEFQRTLRFAVKSLPAEPEPAPEEVSDQAPTLRVFSDAPAQDDFTPSHDAVADLDRLEPFQLAGALQTETPRTAALIIGAISDSKAGDVLSLLPPALQSQTFLELQAAVIPPRQLLERFARTTVERAMQVSPDDVRANSPDSDERMAGLLRGMSRAERTSMIQALEDKDEDAATRIRGLVFRFDDLRRVQTRTIQRILSDLATPTLAKSLKDADPEILAKIQGCMSQRAWATVAEELEVAASTSQDDVDAARAEIIQVMAMLDQSGELQMEE